MNSRGASRKNTRGNNEYSSYNRQVDQLDKLIENDRAKSRGMNNNSNGGNNNAWG